MITTWLLPIILGIFHALSFAGKYLPLWVPSILQIVSLSAFLFLIIHTHKKRKAFLQTWLFGITNFSLSVYWLFISMHYYGGLHSILAGLAVILFAAYLGAYWAGAVALTRLMLDLGRLNSERTQPLILSLIWAASFTLAELARGYFFTGFPWNGFAYAHLEAPFKHWAPIAGSYGVTFVVVWLSALLAYAAKPYNLINKSKLLIVSVSLILISALLSFIPWASPSGKPLSARLIQGNIDQLDKFNPDIMFTKLYEQLQLANEPAKNPHFPPEAIIFPETILPAFQNQLNPDFWLEVIKQSRKNQASYFIGAPLNIMSIGGNERMSNGLLVIDPQTAVDQLYSGYKLPVYEKQHLVPFGEFIPFGFKWFVNALNIPLGDFDAGHANQSNFTLNDQILAPNICYEDIYGEEIIDSVLDRGSRNPGATILFNISNLAWFGDSIALHQHFQQSRMRSIEAARPMLRATNTGVTAYIDHQGNAVDQLPTAETGYLDVMVQGTKGTTWYARTENLPILLLSLSILMISYLWKYGKRREEQQKTE